MALTDRDKARLVGVHPKLVDLISQVLTKMANQQTPMFVVQGVRSQAQQQADYAKGRTAPGKVVTYCDGIKTKGPHQPHADGFGYAVDCAFLPSVSRPEPYDPTWPWADYGEFGENLGLRWGGRFVHLGDLDHLEMPDETSDAPDSTAA